MDGVYYSHVYYKINKEFVFSVFQITYFKMDNVIYKLITVLNKFIILVINVWVIMFSNPIIVFKWFLFVEYIILIQMVVLIV